MSYLIYINETTNEILHPDVVKLFPGFKKLDQDTVLFIVLAYDYCSPYAQFTEQDRLRRASLHVWNDDRTNVTEQLDVKRAIEAYKSLQYNHKTELSKVYHEKLSELEVHMKGLSSVELIDKNIKAINTLRTAIRDLEQEILQGYMEEVKLVGGGTPSFLENMLKNRDLYNSIVKLRETPPKQ